MRSCFCGKVINNARIAVCLWLFFLFVAIFVDVFLHNFVWSLTNCYYFCVCNILWENEETQKNQENKEYQNSP